ncbi:MAG: DnaJ domain-containing protein [Pseudomonadota bacterium]
MDDSFEYTPRFVDIRIKPPKDEPSAAERVCEYPGCRKHAGARAPKSPTRQSEYYWFCQEHAGEYNKSWDFFDGMDDIAKQAFYDASANGHRPTWSFSAGSSTRRRAQSASVDWSQVFRDPFSLFGDRPPPGWKPGAQGPAEGVRKPRPGRLQERALETLGLELGAGKAQVRKSYAEKVRLYHPDSNGGDRSMEDRLQKVVAAYQILKSAGLA